MENIWDNFFKPDPENSPEWEGWAFPDWLKGPDSSGEYENVFTTQTQRGDNPFGTIALVGVAFVLGMMIFGRE